MNDEDDFKPLTAEEAAVVKASNPALSPWRVVGFQIVAMVLVAVLAYVFTQKASVMWSAAWGGLAVVIPAAVFARGLMSRVTLAKPANAVIGFFVWEMVKMALTLAMLLVAQRQIENLSWPALLVGLVVTMKVYWLALLIKPVQKINPVGGFKTAN